jgi:hypothetical protein
MLDEEAIVGVRNSHQIMRQQRIRTFNTNARKDHLTGDSSLMGKPPKQTKFEVEPQLFPSRFGREMACQLVASPMEMAEDDDHSNFPRPQGTFIPGPTFIRMENTEPRSSVIPSTVVEDDMDEVGFQRLTDCWASNLTEYIASVPDRSAYECLFGPDCCIFEELPAIITHNCLPVTEQFMSLYFMNIKRWVDVNKSNLPALRLDHLLAIRMLATDDIIPMRYFLNKALMTLASYKDKKEWTHRLANVAPLLKLIFGAASELEKLGQLYRGNAMRHVNVTTQRMTELSQLGVDDKVCLNGIIPLTPPPLTGNFPNNTNQDKDDKTLLRVSTCTGIDLRKFRDDNNHMQYSSVLLLAPAVMKLEKVGRTQRIAFIVAKESSHNVHAGLINEVLPPKVSESVSMQIDDAMCFVPPTKAPSDLDSSLSILDGLLNNILCGQKNAWEVLAEFANCTENDSVSTIAQAMIAVCYATDVIKLVPTDLQKANAIGTNCLSGLMKMAGIHCKRSQYLLSQFYFQAISVPQNSEKAMELCQLSASQHYIPAIYKLAVQRAKLSVREGLAGIQLAADEGFVLAQNALATYLELGRGIPQDLVRAQRYYAKAADAGHANSCFRLGMLYLEGEDTENTTKAKEYLEKAANLGCSNAKEQLRILIMREDANILL